MKTFITMAALVAVIATPALAQTQTQTQTQRRAPAQQDLTRFDQSLGRSEAQQRAINSPNAVYDGDVYLGADPDPNVRLNLRMDYEHRD